MKFSLECDVIGSYTKVEQFKAVCNGQEYEFTPNEDGFVSKIKVTATAKHPEHFIVSFTPNEDNDGKTISFEYDGIQVHEVLTGDFQYLEGMLAWRGNITRINWQSAILQYLPETDEEKARIETDLIKIEPVPNTIEFQFTAEQIAQFLLRSDFHGKLFNQFFSFFRQGQNYLREERFISAFLYFYLFLEGAYAEEGHWKNFQVKNDFLASPEFHRFIQETIDEQLPPKGRLTWSLNKMLSELKDAKGNPTPKILDAEGIASLLISTRGSLFHFRLEEGLDQPVRVDTDYEAIANVAYSLTQKTLANIYDKGENAHRGIILEQRKRKAARSESGDNSEHFDSTD
jgi:hypothetical protein